MEYLVLWNYVAEDVERKNHGQSPGWVDDRLLLARDVVGDISRLSVSAGNLTKAHLTGLLLFLEFRLVRPISFGRVAIGVVAKVAPIPIDLINGRQLPLR